MIRTKRAVVSLMSKSGLDAAAVAATYLGEKPIGSLIKVDAKHLPRPDAPRQRQPPRRQVPAEPPRVRGGHGHRPQGHEHHQRGRVRAPPQEHARGGLLRHDQPRQGPRRARRRPRKNRRHRRNLHTPLSSIDEYKRNVNEGIQKK